MKKPSESVDNGYWCIAGLLGLRGGLHAKRSTWWQDAERLQAVSSMRKHKHGVAGRIGVKV